MTTVLEPPRARTTTVGPALPQVNLLPPEVRAARGLHRIKQWLGVGLALTVLMCAAVYVFGMLSELQAAAELVTVQGETLRLQTEQAKYSEVPQVLAALDDVELARTQGMSTEVEWKTYFDLISDALPADVTVESLAVSGATPMIAANPPTDLLQGPSVGQISFAGQSATLPDTAAWVDALNSIEGFSDASVSSATVGELDGLANYTVTSTVQFTDAAYANRFAAAEGSE